MELVTNICFIILPGTILDDILKDRTNNYVRQAYDYRAVLATKAIGTRFKRKRGYIPNKDELITFKKSERENKQVIRVYRYFCSRSWRKGVGAEEIERRFWVYVDTGVIQLPQDQLPDRPTRFSKPKNVRKGEPVKLPNIPNKQAKQLDDSTSDKESDKEGT